MSSMGLLRGLQFGHGAQNRRQRRRVDPFVAHKGQDAIRDYPFFLPNTSSIAFMTGTLKFFSS